MSQKTVANAIIDRIVAEGATYIFVGPPTSHELVFVDALNDRLDEITPILVRHEAMAPFMAEGWFRATGTPGVFHVGAGPSLANSVIGVMSAFTCGSAVIGISGSNHTGAWGRNAMQEIENRTYAEGHRILEPIVKKYWQVAHPEKIGDVLNHAYSVALSGRPGPVLLDVPMDLFEKECEVDDPAPARHRPSGRPAGDPRAVDDSYQLLLRSEAPVLLCGHGVVAGEASAEAIELAERFAMPVVTTFNGKSAIPADHPLAIGPIGALGTEPAFQAVREADLVVALGTRFDEWGTSTWTPGLPFDFSTTRLIQVDIVPDEIGRVYPVSVGIEGDVKHVLQAWVARARSAPVSSRDGSSDWVSRLQVLRDNERRRTQEYLTSSDRPVRPERVVAEMQKLLARDAILMPDAGAHGCFFDNAWDVYLPGTFIRDKGAQAMGYAPSAALGVKLGRPAQDVVVVAGDGCMTQANWVLATAAEYGIPVKFVIFNDSALGIGVATQEALFGRTLCSEFTHHASGKPYTQDFALLAQSYQVEAARVTDPADVSSAIATMLSHDGPYLVDIVTEVGAVPQGPGGLWVTDRTEVAPV